MRTIFLLTLASVLSVAACSSDDVADDNCEGDKCATLGNAKGAAASTGGTSPGGTGGTGGTDSSSDAVGGSLSGTGDPTGSAGTSPSNTGTDPADPTAGVSGSSLGGSGGTPGTDVVPSGTGGTGGVPSIPNTAPVDPIIDGPACGECAGQMDCSGPAKGTYCNMTLCVCDGGPVKAADGVIYNTRWMEVFIAEGDNGRYCSECPGTSDRTCWRQQGQYIWDRCNTAPQP